MCPVPLQGINPMREVAQVGLDGVRRTDWHDYEAMRRDGARVGRSALCADAADAFASGNMCSVIFLRLLIPSKWISLSDPV